MNVTDRDSERRRGTRTTTGLAVRAAENVSRPVQLRSRGVLFERNSTGIRYVPPPDANSTSCADIDFDLTGVVLAGGFSTRFDGGDKALADLDGRPMLAHVVDRLGAVADPVVLNCRPEQVDPFRDALSSVSVTVRVATDSTLDCGPLAGIRTALDAVDAEYAAVVACDMPLVDPDFLAALADRATGHDAALVRLDDGWLRTTQAVYRTGSTREAAAAALSEPGNGDGRIVDAFDALDIVVVDGLDGLPGNERTFFDVNTPADLARARELV